MSRSTHWYPGLFAGQCSTLPSSRFPSDRRTIRGTAGVVALVLLLLGTSPPAVAETTAAASSDSMGVVRGYVYDVDTGDPLPGATVMLIRKSRRGEPIRVKTNDDGHYQIEVPVGTYVVRSRFAGYSTTKIREFVVRKSGIQILCPEMYAQFKGTANE